jgi:hypothetical protein
MSSAMAVFKPLQASNQASKVRQQMFTKKQGIESTQQIYSTT